MSLGGGQDLRQVGLRVPYLRPVPAATVQCACTREREWVAERMVAQGP